MNNVKANKKPSNIVLLKRIAFSQSRQPAWQLQSQNFQSFSQQFHPQTYSGLKCVPITWWMKCPTLFGKLQRAILDLHQKEGTHSCSICNVYLWFSITTGCGEINCCSLLCFKTPMETLQISFYSLFFFFFLPILVKMWTKKRKSTCGLIRIFIYIVIRIAEEKLKRPWNPYKLKYTVRGWIKQVIPSYLTLCQYFLGK